MDYAFDIARHDRTAELRKDDAWRTSDQDIRVMVIGGEHVATVGGKGIRWISIDDAPDGQWLFLGTKDGRPPRRSHGRPGCLMSSSR